VSDLQAIVALVVLVAAIVWLDGKLTRR